MLAQERADRERERWSLLRHARDEAERSLALAAQLDIKDQQLNEVILLTLNQFFLTNLCVIARYFISEMLDYLIIQ